MHRRSLSLALALALAPMAAHSEDLLQTYRIARTADPQLQSAEAGMRSSKEGAVQARSALLPQIGASASGSANRTTSPGGGYTFDPITGAPIRLGSNTTNARSASVGVRVDQVIFNRGYINN